MNEPTIGQRRTHWLEVIAGGAAIILVFPQHGLSWLVVQVGASLAIPYAFEVYAERYLYDLRIVTNDGRTYQERVTGGCEWKHVFSPATAFLISIVLCLVIVIVRVLTGTIKIWVQI